MVKVKTALTTLIYLIALLGIAPVFPYVDNITRVFVIATCVAGMMFDWKERYHVSGLLPTFVSIGFFFLYAARFTLEDPVLPAVNLVVVLLCIRLLTEKNERNSLQIVALSLFALAGSSLLNMSMTFLLYLVLFFLSIAVFLVFLNFKTSGMAEMVTGSELKNLTTAALAMPALSVPLLLLFFIILPRTQYPILNFLNSSERKVTGFAEKVAPGSSSTVSQVKNVVFRAQGPRLADRELYWRGIVLNAVEGNAWTRAAKRSREIARPGKGTIIKQTIYPEPASGHYLFTLNTPLEIYGIRADRDDDNVFVSRDYRQTRVKYEAVSVLTHTIRVRGSIDRNFYLQLPQQISPKLISLSESLSENAKTDAEKVKSLKKYFLSEKFSYATMGLPHSSNPVEDFLFSTKRGNCEFFATSFAVLLRAMGVPARLVGGYYGGEYNNIGGYYVVTEDMAHIWVEAFVEGTGWLMIDPTRFSANVPEINSRLTKGPLAAIHLLIDSLGYYWNKAVITFDLEKQMLILRKTNDAVRGIRFSFPLRGLIFFGLAVALCATSLLLLKNRLRKSREEKLVRKLIRKVRDKYPALEIDRSTGLHDLSQMTNDPAIKQFAELYYPIVCHGRKLHDKEYLELLKLVDRI